MSKLNLGLALIGGLVLFLSVVVGALRASAYLPSEPIVAVVFGVALGPVGFDVLRLTPLGPPRAVLEQVARLTIAVAVTSIALRLPPSYYRRRARALAAVLGPGMAFMWLASSLVAYAALSLPPWTALLVGAVVTPTDPVLANTIVVGRTAAENIPERLRYFLSGEAGINDGAAYLFVFLPLLILRYPVEAALSEWVVSTLVWEVGGAVVLGALIGSAVGRVERWTSERRYVEKASVLTVTIALTFAVLGFVKLLGSDGILAVFVAGAAYNWQANPRDEAREQRVEEVFNRLFTLPVFVFFGMSIPWVGWATLGWRGAVLVGGVLAFRRLPMILLLRRYVDPIDDLRAALFAGWFGPIGVAAIFYSLLAVRETELEIAWTAGSLLVGGSLLAHGLTATPLTHRYGELGDDAE
ncbi:cation:proton antiporter [Halopelagius fulvigenes]|uniref:Cation:proton antiporter n=1 Tax=Halopelagius fulvigenes TaxID=1198324 RepID=A0ABD5U3J2_9EURY